MENMKYEWTLVYQVDEVDELKIYRKCMYDT